MVIGNDDLGPFQISRHVVGHKFPALIITVRVVGLQDPEPVPDGDTRSDRYECEYRARISAGNPIPYSTYLSQIVLAFCRFSPPLS